MKKILFIVPSLIGGGVERCLLNILNKIDLEKYEVTVLAIMSGGELVDAIPRGIKYRYCWKREIRLFGKRLKGTDRIFQSVFKTLSPKTLHKLFINDTYDVEIDYWGQEGLKLCLGSDNNTKKISFIHSQMDTDALMKSYFPFKDHNSLSYAYLSMDIIACVSNDCRNSMLNRFEMRDTEAEKVIVSYNINLTSSILEKSKEGIGIQYRDVPILSACGRLYHIKGFKRLIEIVKRLIDEGISCRLWILGEGEERKNLEQVITELRLEKYVLLLGFQDNPYKYMAKSTLFVCSSYYEGFSTVVSEAVVLGLPVVSTDCTGAREILGDSEYGLVTEKSDEALYLGLKAMLTNSSMLQHYRQAVIKRSDFFNENTRMKEFEQLLE